MEKHHESAYRCSRVGHAACQPDLRSDCGHRRQSDLWRLRLGTELPLLWRRSIRPIEQELSVQSPCDGVFSTMRPALASAA